MITFQVLDPATNIHRHLFIEASAGTGKTFTIQHLVARRLLEAPALEPHEIAVITFTRAVAGEVRSRIEETLLTARSNGSVQERVKVQKVLRDFPSMEINTLHGFCRRLLEDFSDRELSEVEWVSDERLFEIVTEILDRGIGNEILTAAGLQGLRRSNHFDDRQLVAQLLRRSESIKPPPSRLSLLEEVIKGVSQYRACDVECALVEYADLFCGLKTKEKLLKKDVEIFIKQYKNLFNENTRSAALDYFESTGKTIRTLFCQWRKGERTAEEKQLILFIEDIFRDIDSKLEDLVLPSRQLARTRFHLHQHLRHHAVLHGWLTPDMLIEEVEVLARTDEQFIESVRNRFRAVIVDEFQDTDPLQWSILSSLFLKGSWQGHLYLVGDPKQAMYSFRAADVYSYMAARREVKDHETLNVNYRASKQMISGLNHLFTGALSQQLFYLPMTEQSLEIPKIQGGFEGVSPAIEMALFYGRLGKKRTWPHREIEQEKIFPWILDRIYWLERRGIALRKIAILVRDRHQSSRIQHFLEEHGVKTNVIRSDATLTSEAVPLLKAFFSLLQSPKDFRRLKQLLSIVPQCSFRQEIEDDIELIGAMLEPFQKISKEYSFCGPRVAFSRFLNQISLVHGKKYEGILYQQQESNALLWDIEAVFDALSEELTVDVYSLPQVLTFLEELHERPEKKEIEARFDPSNDGVVIMTMHKSKGLEFENVFALGVASRTPASDSSPQKIDELDAEKSRLLYVACTRAKERLYLPVLIEQDGKKSALGSASAIELLLSAALQVKSGLSPKEGFIKRGEYSDPDLLEEACRVLVDENQSIALVCPIMQPIKERSIVAKERKKQHSILEPVWAPLKRSSFTWQKSPKGLSFSGPGGRACGIAFHKEMERQFKSRQISAEIAAIEISYEGKRYRLEEFLGWNILTEVPFSYVQDSQEVAGVIDLLIFNEREVFAIDWKTHDWRQGQEGMRSNDALKEMVDVLECDLQGRIYKEAILRWGGSELTFLGIYFIFIPGGRVAEGYEVFHIS